MSGLVTTFWGVNAQAVGTDLYGSAMSLLKRFFHIALVSLFMAAPVGSALGAQEETVQDVPVRVTALDQAAVEAISTTEPATSDWRSIAGATGLNPPSEVRIVSVRAIAFAFDDQGVFDPSRMEVLRGPQSVLFGRDATTVGNEPSPPFYEAQPVGTAVVVETTGWPPQTVDELFELALAFTWTGDEVLEESQFGGDPLLGFGNVSSEVWFGEEQFPNYAKVQLSVWNQFADPLLRFATTTVDDRQFTGWLLPGIPENLQVTLSHSFDQTLDSMIAQQVRIPVPIEIETYPLEADYGLLDSELQTSFGLLLADAADPPGEAPPAEEPAAEDPPAVDVAPDPEATGDSDQNAQQGTPAAADETPPSETTQQQNEQTQGQPDDESSTTLLLILILLLIGLPAIAYGLWRLIRNKPGGGMVAVDPPQTAPAATTAPPPSMPRPLMAGEKGEQALLDGTGSDPSQYKSSDAPHPVPPVVSAHPNPPERLMSDRDEALGVAEVLDGTTTPDGWHRLPWATDSQFSVLEDGKTYRTIPVRDVDLQSDVTFLGEPPGFEPDIERYAYWMHDDGTLKIGSPTDPHDSSGSARGLDHDLGEGESESLEDIFDDIEGEPSSLEGVIDQIMLEDDHVPPPPGQRLYTAHRLSSDIEPVDGWLAPSEEAASIAMIDGIHEPPEDPEAWSGYFVNVEEQELVGPDDPRYEELCERLGVQPPPPPPESGIPLNVDDTPGIN